MYLAKLPVIIIAALFAGLNIDAANILYLSGVPTTSHFIWNRALINGLAANGHNITVASADVDTNPPNNVNYYHLEEAYPLLEKTFALAEDDDSVIGGIKLIYDWCHVASEGIALSKGFKALLSYPDNFKFDLVINDYTCGSFLLGFLEKFGYPPLIAVTAFNYPPYAVDIIGGHKQMAYVPFYLLQYGEEMNFFQRTINFGVHVIDKIYRHLVAQNQMTALMRESFNADTPHVEELDQRSALMFININPAIDFPESLPPNTIAVGGIQITDAKLLPEEQEKFLTTGKKGAVFFSLGSMIQSDDLGPEKIQLFLDVFNQFPEYNFLWKLRKESLPTRVPNNVLTTPWASQNDILAHKNLKLFITHGGLLSTHEATWHGVPILGIPFHADQYRNLFKLRQLGIGEVIAFNQITTTEVFRKALGQVLNDRKYSFNAKVVASNFHDQPEKPLIRAVWWTEWLLRNPNPKHLRPPTLRLGFLSANCYDIVIVATILFLVVTSVVLKIVKKVKKWIFSGGKEKRE